VKRKLFNEEHEMFRRTFRHFVETEIVPHNEEWEKQGIVSRELYRRAGEQGFLGMAVPEKYGGAGIDDYCYASIMQEEIARSNASSAGLGLSLHNDIVLPYILRHANEEQKQRWLPGVCSGESILAIAMTEPNTGSDLASIRATAVRQGDHYIVNGAKTFITNGILSDLIIVAAKTDPMQGRRGMSLLMVERGMPGFTRGRKLDKIGLKAQDTAELFLEDVRVPIENLLGEEGHGFKYLISGLPGERMSIAIMAVAACQAALELTTQYCKDRTAFGQPIGSFQNSRFKLAEMATEIEIARVFTDRCIEELNAGTLTVETAAMAKWWTTELQGRVMDQCL